MKLGGILLLLAGWVIVITAIVLLFPPVLRGLFVLAGMAVEILGLGLAFRKEVL